MSGAAPTGGAALRYTPFGVVLHWIMAAAIIAQIGGGMVMEHLPSPPIRIAVVQLHASVGVAVLLLGVARLGWRFGHPPPPADPGLPRWEALLAQAVSVGLYVAMIAMPVLGWAILSASPRILKSGMFLFWTKLAWPPLPVISTLPIMSQALAHDRFVFAHWAGGLATVLLLLLHVAGALRHRAWSFARMSLRTPVPPAVNLKDPTHA